MGGGHGIENAWRGLMTAVLSRAFDDLKIYGREKAALVFLLSEDCEFYCTGLDVDFEMVKEKAAKLYRVN
jgi:hypothetical protein